MDNDESKLEIVLKDNYNKITYHLNKLSNDFMNNIIDPFTLEEIRRIFKYIRKFRQSSLINLEEFKLSMPNIIIFRKFLLVDDKIIRILTIKIIRYYLEFFSDLGEILKKKMFPIIICKIFEDHKLTTFEERLEVNKYLKFSVF